MAVLKRFESYTCFPNGDSVNVEPWTPMASNADNDVN